MESKPFKADEKPQQEHISFVFSSACVFESGPITPNFNPFKQDITRDLGSLQSSLIYL